MTSTNYNIPYQGYATRFPNGAMASNQIGDTWGALYYSQNIGPMHVIVMNNYIPFAMGTAQYNFVQADLAAVNRITTPWLVVVFHAPPYHTYYTHYKEMDCFLSLYENMFVTNRVDFVINGHVHAYERTHPVANYNRNPCGPVYVVVGDGGNIEGPYRNFADDFVPGTSTSFCTQAWAANFASNPAYITSPTYQLTAQPNTCGAQSWQSANGATNGLGFIANPLGGAQYWCQSSQPQWSAYRDPSFGFAGLTFLSDTQATLKWYRNADQNSNVTQNNPTSASFTLYAADSVTYTRFTGSCAANNSPPPPPPPSPSPPPPVASPPPPGAAAPVVPVTTYTGYSMAGSAFTSGAAALGSRVLMAAAAVVAAALALAY